MQLGYIIANVIARDTVHNFIFLYTNYSATHFGYKQKKHVSVYNHINHNRKTHIKFLHYVLQLGSLSTAELYLMKALS